MLITTISKIKETVSGWKMQGAKIGIVPTMGALHAGHASLIKKAVEICDKVIVSVFVNPIQFGPSEDYDKYPRTLDDDVRLAEGLGADVVFAPSPEEMYGKGQRLSNDNLTYVAPPFFYVDKLCGKTRTGHFDGVCTVVLKLFNITRADYGFFGQKDAQQFIILKKMVNDLNVPIELISCPIIREESGLALSSRNKYLDEQGKKSALALSQILNNIKNCYAKGVTDVAALKETAFRFLNESHELEYLEFVDKNTLEYKTKADNDTLVLIACKVKSVRLIDNTLIAC
ncbi:MAG: pantoate--beta-alanine ligase [Candidatus Gastranaerophilales bacterium]|nr:pantoate--beta-alanine ligase [Candidatus Gastranaerophilales bacterium]